MREPEPPEAPRGSARNGRAALDFSCRAPPLELGARGARPSRGSPSAPRSTCRAPFSSCLQALRSAIELVQPGIADGRCGRLCASRRARPRAHRARPSSSARRGSSTGATGCCASASSALSALPSAVEIRHAGDRLLSRPAAPSGQPPPQAGRAERFHAFLMPFDAPLERCRGGSRSRVPRRLDDRSCLRPPPVPTNRSRSRTPSSSKLPRGGERLGRRSAQRRSPAGDDDLSERSALTERVSGRPLGEIIVARGFAAAPTVAQALATQHGGLLKTEYGFATGWSGQEAAEAAPFRAPGTTRPRPSAHRSRASKGIGGVEAFARPARERLAQMEQPASTEDDPALRSSRRSATRSRPSSPRRSTCRAGRRSALGRGARDAESRRAQGRARRGATPAPPVNDPRLNQLMADRESLQAELTRARHVDRGAEGEPREGRDRAHRARAGARTRIERSAAVRAELEQLQAAPAPRTRPGRSLGCGGVTPRLLPGHRRLRARRAPGPAAAGRLERRRPDRRAHRVRADPG